jgi:hypothetical protein
LQDVIPEQVFLAIQTYLRERTAHAERGWEGGADDEDALTGDFGGSLRTPHWIESMQNGTLWRWQVRYKKVRGKGDGAPEKEIGADGVFQIEVHPQSRPLVVYKGILFQAKKDRGSSRSDLIDQVEDMERIAPGGSAVFEFGPEGYRGASGKVILATRRRRPERIPHPEESLGRYLADRFLPCESGLRGMYYDFMDGTLIVPVGQGVVVRRIRPRHLIEVEVKKGR